MIQRKNAISTFYHVPAQHSTDERMKAKFFQWDWE
jgi:hypothetical protein